MRRVENGILRHINALSSPLGAPVELYAESLAMTTRRSGKTRGKASDEVIRCPFINPMPGVRLTHVVNLDKVHVGVHHREDASRYTDFALVFAPLQLVAVSPDGSQQKHDEGPYTTIIEFKTSDSSVMSDVRVADRGGEVDTRPIPDPLEADAAVPSKRKSATQVLGGLLRSATSTAVKTTAKVANWRQRFDEFEDEEDEKEHFYAHDCVQALTAWLKAEIATPIERLILQDIESHDGKGF